MKRANITIIGCGNLGTSIAQGLLKSKGFSPGQLTLTRRNVDQLAIFRKLGVNILTDNQLAVKEADIILLAVKPYNLLDILKQIQPALNPQKQILISLATGITISEMFQVLDQNSMVFRAMPNIAADVNESVTCICNKNASHEVENEVKQIFDTIGESIAINEDLMEAATVIGACGIAYVLRFMRAMIQGGIQIGFDANTASSIVNQTVKGAAEMMIQQPIHPEAAIDKVTTPKGCTIVGLNEMEHHGFSAAMVRGIIASYDKISK